MVLPIISQRQGGVHLTSVDDPFEELAAAACNLLADSLGVRYSGVITLEKAELKGGSSEFSRLPADLRDKTIAAICDDVLNVNFDDDSVHTTQLIQTDVDESIGDQSASLFFPETETVVFVIPAPGRTVALAPFRRAAVSALPIVYRVDDLRAERAKLMRTNVLLQHVQEISKIGGWEQALGTDKLTWSEAVYDIHGIEPGGDVTLDRILSMYPSPAREKLALAMEKAAAEGDGFELTGPIDTPSGERRIVRTVARSASGREGAKLYGISQDVTSQLNAERRLWWAANHDPVTSLPNRLLFEDRLGVAVRRAKREDRRFALVIIEISDFARLTQRAGYTVPDKNMMEIAGRLGAVTRESDTIARISINEFALILHDINDRNNLDITLERLREQFKQVEGSGGGGSLVMSAGVAYYPEHASADTELIRAAEIALSRAKRKLTEPVIVFDRKIAAADEKRRATILAQARDSLNRREFLPYYQPQIDMETNAIVGVEALVRWQTPDMTLDAKDFAYALDDHEIGSRVGRAVLDAVIADISSLRAVTERPFRVSINASRTEVLRNDFLETFLEKTRTGNLRPNDFIIEITEDVIIGVDDKSLHEKINYLVTSGVEFSLDDFGTGYASLIHITSFPVTEIKIDKQFIFGIETDRRKRAIVRGVLQIAQSMGLNVIAEGVETAEQQEALREIGCRYAQGYLYSFPVPFAQFAAMVEQQHV
ncbi:MAG: bifunctional diguanylate cyclase/phosphodiesterase [Pseudomonadota bacterium]